jgi:hypothetical protein
MPDTTLAFGSTDRAVTGPRLNSRLGNVDNIMNAIFVCVYLFSHAYKM